MSSSLRSVILDYARELGFQVSDDMICTPEGRNCQRIEDWLRSPIAVAVALSDRELEVAYNKLNTLGNRNLDFLNIEIVQQYPFSCWAATASALTFYARNIDPNVQAPDSDTKFINLRYDTVPMLSNSTAQRAIQATGINRFNLTSTQIQKMNSYINETNSSLKIEHLKDLYMDLDDGQITMLCTNEWGNNYVANYRKIFFYKLFYQNNGLDTAFTRLWFDDECGLKYEHFNPCDDKMDEFRIVSTYGNSGPFITAVLPEILLYKGRALRNQINTKYANTNQPLSYHYIIIYNVFKDNNNTMISIWSSLHLQNGQLLSRAEVNNDPKLRNVIPTCQIIDVSLKDFILCWKKMNEILVQYHSQQNLTNAQKKYMNEYNQNDFIPIVTIR